MQENRSKISLGEMNLNYLLNKAYYMDMPCSHYDVCNNILKNKKYKVGTEEIPFTENSFVLKTVYPGLLIGLGNPHEAGKGKTAKETEGAEIKLGFTLDYVTGLPIIPGSTVKGMLRSAFEHHIDYVTSLVATGGDNLRSNWKLIFEEGSSKVVFFDAIPVAAGKDGHILGLENITLHPSPLKNPNPLTLLKVIPGVEFLFRFGVTSYNEEIMAKDPLLDLFQTIICDLGMGAKTNVGFGIMTRVKNKSQVENVGDAPAYYFLEQVSSQTPSEHESKDPVKNANICKTPGCSNQVPTKNDGRELYYCPQCIQKYNKTKGGKS